jgi:aspartate/methionine/tyrosine aminotransferase
LAINPAPACAASEVIHASRNHYSPAEGVIELRNAVAQKVALFNGVKVDPQATPLELLITPGATGGLIAIANTYLTSTWPWSLSLATRTTDELLMNSADTPGFIAR